MLKEKYYNKYIREEKKMSIENLKKNDKEPAEARKIHEMLIKPEFFDKVKTGEKIYEARTNDDRRKAMQIGDIIVIIKEPELTEWVAVEIVDKLEFNSFTELYDSLPKKEVGFEGIATEEIVSELRRFYSAEQEALTGVVAIKQQIIPNFEFDNFESKLSPTLSLQKRL